MSRGSALGMPGYPLSCQSVDERGVSGVTRSEKSIVAQSGMISSSNPIQAWYFKTLTVRKACIMVEAHSLFQEKKGELQFNELWLSIILIISTCNYINYINVVNQLGSIDESRKHAENRPKPDNKSKTRM